MNSVANGRIYRNTPFKRLYVQAAAGDAGGAIGAAFVAWHQAAGSGARFVMDHAFWGPAFPDAEIGTLLGRHKEALDGEKCVVRRIPDEGELVRLAAEAINVGLVVGWFQVAWNGGLALWATARSSPIRAAPT